VFNGPALSAGKVGSAFFFIASISFVLLLMIIGAMVFFLIRYRRSKHPEPEEVMESLALEIGWTAVPVLLVVLMFYFGWIDFEYIRNPPKDAMIVDVVGRQWSWLFKYANGKQEDVLRVPLGKPVNLIMTSQDVIHSFFVPAFRIKEDCVPGMKTHLWFQATETGSYEVFCTEYCGQGHSHMRSRIIVLPQADFDKWYQAQEETGAAAEGLRLLKSKGCLGCHSTDGTRKVGPTYKGLFGKTETVLTNGKKQTVTVDAAFIKHYVRDPNVERIPGFQPIMPKIQVTDGELDKIVAYLETLK
jgi:cytochrome c oxidase subunit 2